MLEIMNALGAGSVNNMQVAVSFETRTYRPGDTITFTVDYQDTLANTVLYWTLGGDFTQELIDGDMSGSFDAPGSDGPGSATVSIKTKIHGTLEATRTMTLQIRTLSTKGNILTESDPIAMLYSGHPIGQISFIDPGTHAWVVPEDVYYISGVCVGGGMASSTDLSGAGGQGGALRWRNDISVTPGETLTVVVPAGGKSTSVYEQRLGGIASVYRGDTPLLVAAGGGRDVNVSTAMTIEWIPPHLVNNSTVPGYWSIPTTGDQIGGGEGGLGATGGTGVGPGGGGGAGGYLGNGGAGCNINPYTTRSSSGDVLYTGGKPGASNSGAAGGGAHYLTDSNNTRHATPGGGVGLLGLSNTGRGGYQNEPNIGGWGGSGGTDSTWTAVGLYGGGGRGRSSITSFIPGAVDGGAGAVRLIWGSGRAFPNTATGNL